MAFPIDVSRPFRYPSELQKLAEAVHGAGDYDETRWIEWKSTLNLTTQGGIHHVARQIIGFANRDPQIAAPWAGGHAYLLIGVSPGQHGGVTMIDPERLVSQIQAYVGAEVTWTPESIQVGGTTVLVIIIEPPRPGDAIHVLHKDLTPYRKGAVLIRRHGQVVQADDVEMAMLQRRLLSRTEQIAVAVEPALASIEIRPDFSILVDDWAKQERSYRINARYEIPKDESEPVAIGGFFAAAYTRDSRSPARYAAEVDDYIKKCRESQFRRFVHRFGHHQPAQMVLKVINSCERNFSEVRVTVDFSENDARGFEGDLLDLIDLDPPQLPSPPTPYGSPIAGRGGLDSLIKSIHQVPNFVVPKVYWPNRHWHASKIIDGTQRIEFDPYDLRPYESIELPHVPLLVRTESGGTLSLKVNVTATNVDGKLDDQIFLKTVSSTFDPFTEN